MDAPIFPLTSSAMQLNQLSRDFRNQLNKQLHSRNSSPALLIYPGLLSGSSPKHLSRAWLFVLPHLNNGDMGLRSCPLCKLVCQILLWSQGKLLSLQAAYILGAHNIGADIELMHPAQGFVCMHFPRSLCSRVSWREFAGTEFYYFSLPRGGRAEYGSQI